MENGVQRMENGVYEINLRGNRTEGEVNSMENEEWCMKHGVWQKKND